jgi:hypothetical protein
LLECVLMKRHVTLTGLLLLMAAIAPAADVTGRGPVVQIQRTGRTGQGGAEGRFGDHGHRRRNARRSRADQGGKLQGDNVTFWITINYQGNPVKLVYKGKVAGDEIKFEFGTEDGGWGALLAAKKGVV